MYACNLPLQRLRLNVAPVRLGHRRRLHHSSAAVTSLQVATAIQPRGLNGPLVLEALDLGLHLQSKANVIETVDQAVLAESIDIKVGELVTSGVLDLLVDEIDLDFAAGVGLSGDLGQDGLVADDDGQHAVLEGVVEEDIGEGGGDDALDAEVEEGPGGVFTGTTAAEVGAGDDEDLRVAVDALVQDERGVLGAVLVAELVEQGAAKTGALDGLEELLGDDGVGVDVGAVHRGGDALQGGEFGQASGGGGAGGGVGVGFVVSGEVHNALDFIFSGGLFVQFLLHVDLGLHLAEDGAGGDVLAHVGQLANDGGGGSHGGGHEVSATPGTLATLEVTVGGTGTAFLGRENVGVHAQAHGAAGLTPFEARVREDLVKAFGLGLLLNQTRAGDDHGTLDVGGDLLAANNLGGGAEILDTGVGARANENLVDCNVLHGGAGRQAHVFESALAGKLAVLVLEVIGAGNDAVDGDDVLGGGTPGDGGDDVLAVDDDGLVVDGIFVGGQAGPEVDGPGPFGAVDLGSKRTTLQVIEGDLIGSDHTGTGTSFDGHVAHGHTGLHAQAANDGTAELNNGTGTSGGTNDTDDVEDDILTGDTGGQLTVDLDAHVLAATGDEGLGGENVLDLTGTDTEGKGTEGTVCGGVTVTADDSCAGEGETLLRTDDVDNTLALVAHAKVCETEVLDVLLEGAALEAGVVLFDELIDVLEVFAGGGGNVLSFESVRWLPEIRCGGKRNERHTWSTVTRVQSGRRTLRPAFLRPSKAWGDVTSWTRCLSM